MCRRHSALHHLHFVFAIVPTRVPAIAVSLLHFLFVHVVVRVNVPAHLLFVYDKPVQIESKVLHTVNAATAQLFEVLFDPVLAQDFSQLFLPNGLNLVVLGLHVGGLLARFARHPSKMV